MSSYEGLVAQAVAHTPLSELAKHLLICKVCLIFAFQFGFFLAFACPSISLYTASRFVVPSFFTANIVNPHVTGYIRTCPGTNK